VPRPAVFLDRDDTLIEANSLPPAQPPAAPGDVTDPAHVRLLPGAREACLLLERSGFALVVFSNQGGVARGAVTCQRVEEINARLAELLSPARPAFYYCPFHPQGRVPEFTREHPWRKPAPGMILAAAAELDLDLSASWVIGDMARDIEAGRAAGLPAARCVRIGREGEFPRVLGAAAHIVAESRSTR
jgi:D-glycero-D-manno-heptose 1,7-bisphosphate phosphatase